MISIVYVLMGRTIILPTLGEIKETHFKTSKNILYDTTSMADIAVFLYRNDTQCYFCSTYK